MSKSGNQSAAVGPLLWAFALAAVLLAVSFSATNAPNAHAQQGPGPIENGGIVIFEECSIVTLTVLESDAKFTNVFWRFGPDGDLGINSLQTGSSLQIPGQIPANTELVLGIFVTETENTFKTGDASRNPDNEVHAKVSSMPAVTGTTVEFEDKAVGEKNADWDYDDARLIISIAPCPPPQQVTLTVQVDPASTGTGGVAGGGAYDLGFVANAAATAAAGSTFGGWSGDCNGLTNNFAVVMNGNKLCVALFLATPVTPTPPPVTPTPEASPSIVGIDNNLVSLNPARVGETVTFRVDVALDVPAENTADVQYTFDATELDYQSASWNGIALNQCALSGTGVIDCAFGVVSIDFAFDVHFEALKVADDSTTNATLSSDPDGAGAEPAIAAGPAAADVDIIAISDEIVVPPTGDGSVAAASGGLSFQLMALLGATVLATVVGATRLRTGTRS